MNISDFRVEPANYTTDFDDLCAVREAVFITEQNIPKDIEFDNVDADCYHFVARDNYHLAIGTARLSPEQKIGRMAVLQDWRGKGVGKALLLATLEESAQISWTEVTLNAQTNAIGFYEHFGFAKVGEGFMEADIPHQTLHLKLEPLASSGRPDPNLASLWSKLPR